MPSRISCAFYAVGIRIAQALVLSDNTSTDRGLVLAGLDRLALACSHLLHVIQIEDPLAQRLNAMLRICVEPIEGVADSDDYYLSPAYDMCRGRLNAFRGLLTDIARSLAGQDANAASWLELGFEITNGEGNTPWDVPPGHAPRRDPLCWSPVRSQRVDELIEQLGVTRDILLPVREQEAPEWTISHRREYLWGWGRIEMGLRQLESAVIQPDAMPAISVNEEPTTQESPPTGWDAETEARNRWIYEECCAGTRYSAIIRQLPQQSSEWELINTPQGIRDAAQAYATRHRLQPPARRHRGRPPRTN